MSNSERCPPTRSRTSRRSRARPSTSSRCGGRALEDSSRTEATTQGRRERQQRSPATTRPTLIESNPLWLILMIFPASLVGFFFFLVLAGVLHNVGPWVFHRLVPAHLRLI